MKLLCFLITFVLVSASADEEADCKKEVFLANAAFKCAYNLTVGGGSEENGLEYVIERIVNTILHTRNCFAKINYMIAVPEKTDIVIDIPENEHLTLMKRCSFYQYNIQRKILNTLNVDITRSYETQVIAYPEADKDQDFGELNLETLASERREYVVKALQNIFRRELGSKYDNFMSELELKIRDTLTDEVQDLGRLNITTLIEERRVTGTSLENTFTRVIGRNSPEVAEVQYESYNLSKRGIPLLRFCRLMGLYISTQNPTEYIRKLQTNYNSNTCTLWDGRNEKIFRKIDGVWKQFSTTT
ncbi:uncharacterized protein LOC126837906 [Adelges cooleyi]|uniref:uncharacterized protein LOC126837906 n=1 Tax=Adelges cooleyi TaxID=133065 RepID=UPI00217F4662|nr:uncharacterized protein LOC126837906 [Adelges cooleyi]